MFLRQINTCRKVPLKVDFCRWRHFALLSMSLIFLWLKIRKSKGWKMWQRDMDFSGKVTQQNIIIINLLIATCRSLSIFIFFFLFLIYECVTGLSTLLSVSRELVLNFALAPSRVWMGHLLKLKCAHSPLNQRMLSSTSVLFTLTTMPVPNLALTHTKRFTVYNDCTVRHIITAQF